MRLAVGDWNNNGLADIIVAPGPGGGPHLRIFNGEGRILRQFFVDDIKTHAGLSVAIGDIDNNGQNEIIVGLGAGSTADGKNI